MSGPAGGGPPPGVDTAQLASMQQAQAAQGAGGITGVQDLFFGRLSVGQGMGWNLSHMGFFMNLNPGSPFSIHSRLSLLGLKARKAKLLDYNAINPPSLPMPAMGTPGQSMG